jgi:hypothetical protein
MCRFKFTKKIEWVALIHSIFLFNCVQAQDSLICEKIKDESLHVYTNQSSAIERRIHNTLFFMEYTENRRIKVSSFNFKNESKSEFILDLSAHNYTGVIDFYIDNGKYYFLTNNGTRVIGVDSIANKEFLNVTVKNLNSNLYPYSNIYVHSNLVYLIFNIDISEKSNDKRNFFIDKLDTETGNLSSVLKYKLNANVFSVSSYLNYTFDRNHVYLNDILTGEILRYNLNVPENEFEVVFERQYDTDLILTKRVQAIESGYTKSKTGKLLDSIRYFYDYETTSTWMSINGDLLATWDNTPKDGCGVRIRVYNMKTNEKFKYSFYDANSKCVSLSASLNYFYMDDKSLKKVYFMYDPEIKDTYLKYLTFKILMN